MEYFCCKHYTFSILDHRFIRWIETIYHKSLACIKNNGYLSDTFDISRGIRQGYPVNVLLFVLCVEILAIKIRNSSTLKGFQFGFESKPVKIAQYANDGILFLNDKNELCSALNILEIFGRMSGLVLNVEKCEGLWLGRNKFLQTNCNLFGIKWPEQFRCLGTYLGHNKQLIERRNFPEKVDQIEESLINWEKRDLSLIGRVQVIKTFAISKLVFPASLMCIPEHIIKRLNRILFQILWRSKDKVKRIKVIQDMKNGGLNMIDLQSFIKSLIASWVIRIQESPNDIDFYAPYLFLDISIQKSYSSASWISHAHLLGYVSSRKFQTRFSLFTTWPQTVPCSIFQIYYARHTSMSTPVHPI